MANTREIRTKINSITSTQKITRAMELVAASRSRKAQERMAVSKPYATKIRDVIAHVAAANAEYAHAYMQKRTETKRVGFIVVSTDRGLCGGLNINLFKQLLKTMKQYSDQNIGIDLCFVGVKAEAFFKRFGGNVLASATHLGDQPKLQDLIGVVKVMLDKFEEGTLDTIYIAANDFVNTMTQKPCVRKMLPLQPDEISETKGHWDYIYEPDAARELLTQLMKRYIESQVYQAVIENLACEQAARMVAMKSATENAGDLINQFKLIYNKMRQASITQELSEIVSGAAAIE